MDSVSLSYLVRDFFLMDNLQYRLLKCPLNGNERVYGEIVCTTHPLTYLSFFFTKKLGKIFLFKSFIYQNFMNPIYYLK